MTRCVSYLRSAPREAANNHRGRRLVFTGSDTPAVEVRPFPRRRAARLEGVERCGAGGEQQRQLHFMGLHSTAHCLRAPDVLLHRERCRRGENLHSDEMPIVTRHKCMHARKNSTQTPQIELAACKTLASSEHASLNCVGGCSLTTTVAPRASWASAAGREMQKSSGLPVQESARWGGGPEPTRDRPRVGRSVLILNRPAPAPPATRGQPKGWRPAPCSRRGSRN